MKTIVILLLCISTTVFSQKSYRAMEYSLIALNVADFVTTKYALDNHLAQEMNPVMKPIVENPMTFALMKVGITIGSIALLRVIKKDNPKFAFVSLLIMNAGMSYVVTNNFQVCLKFKI